MELEDFFLLMCICNSFLLAWNVALLDSRNFWKKKWEKEIEFNVTHKI